MSAFSRTVHRLRERNEPHALIGAIAMAVYGVQRATADIDLMASTAVMHREVWAGLRGLSIDVRHGDDDDNLLGCVRIGPTARFPVDVVVPRGRWVSRVLGRTEREMTIDGVDVPVLTLADLVLSKVYAGGRQDQADIRALMNLPAVDCSAVLGHVEAELDHCPAFVRRSWPMIRSTLLQS